MFIKTLSVQKDEVNSYYNEKYKKQIDCWEVVIQMPDGKKGTVKTRSSNIAKLGFEGEVTKNDDGFLIKKPVEGFTPRGSYSAPKKEYKDNSDGQRQGMCINNAAQYTIKYMEMTGEQFSPDDFGRCVKDYAQALYEIDLTQPSEPKPEWKSQMEAQGASDKVLDSVPSDELDLSKIPF